jgi:hypothetical protein
VSNPFAPQVAPTGTSGIGSFLHGAAQGATAAQDMTKKRKKAKRRESKPAPAAAAVPSNLRNPY